MLKSLKDSKRFFPHRLFAPARVQTFSTSTEPTSNEKTYVVTTPIFYTNSEPHIGHLYTMIYADAIARWKILSGYQVIFSTGILLPILLNLTPTGTDEHGQKIQNAAKLVGKDEKTFCDEKSETFRTLASKANLSEYTFIRTTDRKDF